MDATNSPTVRRLILRTYLRTFKSAAIVASRAGLRHAIVSLIDRLVQRDGWRNIPITLKTPCRRVNER